jgi:hypothetical protein
MDHRAIQYQTENPTCFSEEQWLKTLLLIRDTQDWLDEIKKGLLCQLPVANKKKLLRRKFYLSATALAHILERHYYKIQRYPNTSKFIIPVVDIIACIRDAFQQAPVAINGSLYVQRVMDVQRMIGFDLTGQSTQIITVISNTDGRIVTAFPGELLLRRAVTDF